MLTMATLRSSYMDSRQYPLPLTSRSRPAALLSRLWLSSPPLAAVGMLMLFVACASVVGLLVDPRIITGAPAWLKPLKFAISTAVYSLTLAWFFTFLRGWPRFGGVVGCTTAIWSGW